MANRAIGITYAHNRKERRIVYLDGESGVPGQDVQLLKKALFATLSRDRSLLPLGATEATTADDIVISRPNPMFTSWEDEVSASDVFVNKQHDLLFHFASPSVTSSEYLMVESPLKCFSCPFIINILFINRSYCHRYYFDWSSVQ